MGEPGMTTDAWAAGGTMERRACFSHYFQCCRVGKCSPQTGERSFSPKASFVLPGQKAWLACGGVCEHPYGHRNLQNRTLALLLQIWVPDWRMGRYVSLWSLNFLNRQLGEGAKIRSAVSKTNSVTITGQIFHLNGDSFTMSYGKGRGD